MMFGRLAEGQTLEARARNSRPIVARQAAEYPDTNRNRERHRAELLARTRRRRRRALRGDLAGGGRAAAARRVRQHRQPAAGPRHRTPAGVRDPAGPRRRAGRVSGCNCFIEGLVSGSARRGVGAGLAALAIGLSRATSCRPRWCGSCPATSTSGSTWRRSRPWPRSAPRRRSSFSLVPALQASRGAGRCAGWRRHTAATASPGRQWMRSLLAGAQVALTHRAGRRLGADRRRA